MHQSWRGDASPRLAWSAVAATVLTVLWGWRVKTRCLGAHWGSPEPFQERCYSDVQALWSIRSFADRWPYRESLNEYPPVTAAFQSLTARTAGSLEAYVHLSAFLLGLAAVGVTVLLLRMGAGRRVFLWALAPAVAHYAMYNWDLLAVLPLMAAFLAWHLDRPGLTGALVAVATLAKWWPAVLLPVFGVLLLRREGGLGKAGWRFGTWAVGILSAVHGAVWLWARDGFLDTFRFHAGRGATLESHWFAVKAYLARWDWIPEPQTEAVAAWAPAAYALLVAAVSGMAWRRGWAPERAAVTLVAGWQVLMPVLSMQYALWLLPLLVLARTPVRLVLAYLVADLLVFLAVMRYQVVHQEDLWKALETQSLAAGLRLVVLAAIVGWSLWYRPRAKAAHRPAQETVAEA